MRSLFHTLLAGGGCAALIVIYKSTQTPTIKLLLGATVVAVVVLSERAFPKRAVPHRSNER
jgi:hypothetical protein